MKKERPFLLVNINNTNTSFALANAKRILRVVKVPTASVHKIPFTGANIKGMILASVVPKMTKRIQHLLPMRPIIVSTALTWGSAFAIRTRTDWVDRLANAVGVAKLYGTPAIVVDFGTAVTFDIVNSSRDTPRGDRAGVGVVTVSLPTHGAVAAHQAGRTGLGDRQEHGRGHAGGRGDWVCGGEGNPERPEARRAWRKR